MAFQKAFFASCAYTHSLLYPFPNPFNPPINYVLMVLAPVYMYFNIICLLFCLNFIHAYTMNDYILDVILSLAPHRSTFLLPTSQFPLPCLPILCTIFFNNPPSPICAAHIFMGVGPSTVWSTYHTLKEIWFPFPPQPPLINSSSVMSGNSGSQELTRRSLLHEELLSDSILHRACKGNHSCSKVVSAVSLSHGEDTIALWSSTISGFLQYFHLFFQDIFSGHGGYKTDVTCVAEELLPLLFD